MSQARDTFPTPPDRRSTAFCGLLGAVALAIIWLHLRHSVLNVVTYRVVHPPMANAPASWILPAVVIGFIVLLTIRVAVRGADERSLGRRFDWPAAVAATMLAALAIGPQVGLPLGFWTLAATCLLTVVLVDRLVTATLNSATAPKRDAAHRWCLAVLVVAIIVATIWHGWMQSVLWRHFMLGYADFGLYTRELEYCLFYNDVADRWANTRMAYHFEPLFYLLAPAYALFRSPVFLMIVGPLALNSAALAFYWLVARRTGSALTGLIAGLAWLALPSISRMPYANTYGFESVYLAVPLLAFCFAAAHLHRWRTSHVLLVLAVLCQETMVAIAVGWGVYIALSCHRKRDGIVIAIAAVVYLAISAGVIIPAISPDGQYVRSEMLGEDAMSQLLSRVSREAYWAFLFALTAPLLPAIFRSPRMMIAAAPTLLMLGLIQNTEYLSIKFWHQSSVLPVIFTCACLGATPRRLAPHDASSPAIKTSAASHSNGTMLGLLGGMLLLHQFMGYSPLAQSWNAQRAVPALQMPDPRMDTINRLRRTYPPSRTRVAATQRIAAHLTDYRGLTTIEHITDNADLAALDVILIDTTDTWDPIVRSGAIRQFTAALQSADFNPRHFGDVRVFANQHTANAHQPPP